MAFLVPPFNSSAHEPGRYRQAGATMFSSAGIDGGLSATVNVVGGGYGYAAGHVGQSFNVRPTDGMIFPPHPPFFPRPLRIITASVNLSVYSQSDAGSASGAFAASGTVTLRLFRGLPIARPSGFEPLAESRVNVEHTVVYGFWYAAHPAARSESSAISSRSFAEPPTPSTAGRRSVPAGRSRRVPVPR